MFTLFLALLSLVAWEHIEPLFARCAACAALFVCAALLPLDWGWYALAIVWGCFYMRDRQRPPGFAAVRYLYGNCRVALAWRAAQFGLAVSAIFRCVFFAFANAAVRRHARRRCAREVRGGYLIYPAQFILIPLLGRRLAP